METLTLQYSYGIKDKQQLIQLLEKAKDSIRGWIKDYKILHEGEKYIEVSIVFSSTEGLGNYFYEWGMIQQKLLQQKNQNANLHIAMEFGYKQCEKGNNFDYAVIEFNKLLNLKEEYWKSIKLTLKTLKNGKEEEWVVIKRLSEFEGEIIDSEKDKEVWLKTKLESKVVHLVEGQEIKVMHPDGECVYYISKSEKV